MIQLFKAKSLKKTQKKEKSKGRSMVEMLGVLAIIGVLSIGGIQGYTIAMRKYRANEILAVITKYAMVNYSACQKNGYHNSDGARDQQEKIIESYNFRPDDLEHYLRYCDPGSSYADDGWQEQDICKDLNSAVGYWICNFTEFTDSGIGSLPNDISWINIQSIKSIKSGDVIAVSIYFTSQDICETVAGMIDYYFEGNDYTPCEYNDLVMHIMMN